LIGYNSHIELTGSLRYLSKGITIGNNVGLGTHGHYGGACGVEIGDDCIVNAGAVIKGKFPPNSIILVVSMPVLLK